MSKHKRQPVRDFVEMRIAELGRHPKGLVVVPAVLAGVIALLLAPDVDTRQDANGLSTLFAGGLTLMGILLAAYVTFAVSGWHRSSAYFNRWAVFFAVTGLVAASCGLLTLPLEAYQFAFAVLIMGAVHGVVTVAVLLMS